VTFTNPEYERLRRALSRIASKGACWRDALLAVVPRQDGMNGTRWSLEQIIEALRERAGYVPEEVIEEILVGDPESFPMEHLHGPSGATDTSTRVWCRAAGV
jgi:hypothetical protein